MAKEKVPKERPPYRVGLRRLCALQPGAGAAELAIAQTVLALFRSKPAVLDNTKGIVKSKTKSQPRLYNLMRCSDHHNFNSLCRRRPVSRNSYKNRSRLEACRNVGGLFGVDLKPPFRLAEKHRMSRGLRDVLSERQRVSHPAGSFEHRRTPAGRACWVSFLLVTFLWISKEKPLAHKGRNTKIRIRIQGKNKKGSCHAERK